MNNTANIYPLFESIRIDEGVPANLEWHQRRFERAYKSFYSNYPSLSIKDIINIPDAYCTGRVKLRWFYNRNAYFTDFQQYKRQEIKSIKLVRDDRIAYPLKYTNRQNIERLFEKKEACDDILIIKGNKITDSSVSNIVFFDGNRWFTPSSPLLKGTSIERLLSEDVISQKDIEIDDLGKFQSFKLVNAMRSFGETELLDISVIRE